MNPREFPCNQSRILRGNARLKRKARVIACIGVMQYVGKGWFECRTCGTMWYPVEQYVRDAARNAQEEARAND